MAKTVVSIRLDQRSLAALDQIATAGSRSRLIEAIIEAFLEQDFQAQRNALKDVRLTREAEQLVVARRPERRERAARVEIESRSRPLHIVAHEWFGQPEDRLDKGQGDVSRDHPAEADDALPVLEEPDQEGG
jgi:metal-responsive CopG/Arc/MetJ family transcriptional regulator